MLHLPFRAMVTIPFLLGTVACKNKQDLTGAQPPDSSATIGMHSEGPLIEIQVRSGPEGSLLVSARGQCANVPLRIEQFNIRAFELPHRGCRISAKDARTIDLPWRLGDVPVGFEGEKCKPLAPGEYEAVLIGPDGDGVRRFRLDAGGAVTILPWDQYERPDLFRGFGKTECSLHPPLAPDANSVEGPLERMLRDGQH